MLEHCLGDLAGLSRAATLNQRMRFGERQIGVFLPQPLGQERERTQGRRPASGADGVINRPRDQGHRGLNIPELVVGVHGGGGIPGLFGERPHGRPQPPGAVGTGAPQAPRESFAHERVQPVAAAGVRDQERTAVGQDRQARRPRPIAKEPCSALRGDRVEHSQRLQPAPCAQRQRRQYLSLHIRVHKRAVRGPELTRRPSEQDARHPALGAGVTRSIAAQTLTQNRCLLGCESQVFGTEYQHLLVHHQALDRQGRWFAGGDQNLGAFRQAANEQIDRLPDLLGVLDHVIIVQDEHEPCPQTREVAQQPKRQAGAISTVCEGLAESRQSVLAEDGFECSP